MPWTIVILLSHTHVCSTSDSCKYSEVVVGDYPIGNIGSVFAYIYPTVNPLFHLLQIPLAPGQTRILLP
jgi:hypothetical protein